MSSLFSNFNRVEVPFVRVTFGSGDREYTFGVQDNNSVSKIKFPNYVRSLNVTKISGVVNKYTLVIDYPITENSDPNYFEKVFSSISTNRKVKFSYGDYNSPNFIYKEEEALIQGISTSFDNTTITYTITAISSATLSSINKVSFPAYRNRKPSDIIQNVLLKNAKYGLLDLFYGMKNLTKILASGILASDDTPVDIEAKVDISVLDYLKYLVSCMIPISSNKNSVKVGAYYNIVFVDDLTGDFGGPYFKIVKLASGESVSDKLETFEIDVGYPSQAIVISFDLLSDDTYSLLYNYSETIDKDSNYPYRVDDQGNVVPTYSPSIATNSQFFKLTPDMQSWWTKVTQFPVKARIVVAGLLRPAILMTKVRLNVLFYGRKHISSGLYVITSQKDTISTSGYRTQLELLRVGEDTL